MRLQGFLQLLFILYCVSAGLLLIFAPWSPLWQRALSRLPPTEAFQLLEHPAARAAACGFGLVHLVWVFHDLEGLLVLRRPYGRDEAP